MTCDDFFSRLDDIRNVMCLTSVVSNIAADCRDKNGHFTTRVQWEFWVPSHSIQSWRFGFSYKINSVVSVPVNPVQNNSVSTYSVPYNSVSNYLFPKNSVRKYDQPFRGGLHAGGKGDRSLPPKLILIKFTK